MTVQSVISIDVDDSKFKAFSEKFARYQELLAKTPNIWKNAGKEQSALAGEMEKMSAALMAQNALAREGSEEDKRRLSRLKESDRLWTSVRKSTADVSKSISNATISLIKWGGLIGAGLLGGSLFGIDKMAAGVSDQRRSSLGLGLSIGQQKSFEVNFGRFVNPGAFLEGVSGAQQLGHQGVLYGLGVNPNQSTEKVALDTMRAIRALVKATPENQLGVLGQSRHLDELSLSLDDLRRNKHTSDSEWNSQFGKYDQGVGAFGVSDATGQRWQNFTNQMEAAGATIFKTFVVGLGPLADPLSKLSQAIVTMLETAMANNGPIQKGIETIASWITDFAKSASTPEFMATVQQFTSDAGTVGDALHTIAQAIQNPAGTAADLAKKGIRDSFMAGPLGPLFGAHFKDTALGSVWNLGRKQMAFSSLENLDTKYGLPKGTLKYVWGKESSYGDNAIDQPGKNGAQGDFQIKPAMGGGANLHDFDQSANRAAYLIALELKRYGGDVQKAVAAYHLGDPTMDATLKRYGSNWQQHVPYVNEIRINNQTGGNAIATVNALAGGR